MRVMESPHSYMGSNLYLTPPSHPPRRKSPVFYLLFAVDLAVVTIFVLSISRLGKEIRQEQLQTGGWFKIFSIAYAIVVAISTTLFLTITLSFFKVVYPPPPPFKSSFSGLRGGEKATVILNFLFSTLWCAGLGIQAGELWVNVKTGQKNPDGSADFSGVESVGRFWARIVVTVAVMIGMLVLGWCSLQGVWRNKHRSEAEN